MSTSQTLLQLVVGAGITLAVTAEVALCADEVDVCADHASGSEFLFYCGCYTTKLGHVEGLGDSIGVYALDSQTGAMRKRGQSPPIVNSSHFCLGAHGKYLYSISEFYEYRGKQDGYLTVFEVDNSTKTLSQIQTISSAGPGPAYVSLDRTGRYLLLANYVAGNVVVFPIQADGRLAAPSANIQHSGGSVNPERQVGPHPHSIVASPDNRFVFVPDLGTDTIVAYRFDEATGELMPAPKLNVETPAGSGPRHLVFSPSGKWAFVSLELSSELMLLEYDGQSIKPRERSSTLPRNYEGANASAEVRTTPDGRHVYVSNRGHNSLAVFSFDEANGVLERIAVTSTQGEIPRNFDISPDGRWLVVANQNSHNLVSFCRDHATGLLKEASQVDSPSPAFIAFFGR